VSNAIFVILACINGTDCRTLQPPQDPAPLMECLATSQAQAAKWQAAHPQWVVRGVRCSGELPR